LWGPIWGCRLVCPSSRLVRSRISQEHADMLVATLRKENRPCPFSDGKSSSREDHPNKLMRAVPS
jgi:hypothetical protein